MFAKLYISKKEDFSILNYGGEVLMANGLLDTGNLVLDPLYRLWLGFVSVVPGLVAAIIILIIGYFIALIIGHVIKLLLEKLGLDSKLKKARMSNAIGHTQWSGLIGEVTKWYVFIIFLQVAISILEIGTLSILLERLVNWLPNLIAAVLILLIGLVVAHIIELKVLEHTQMKGMKMMSSLIKLVIIILVTIIGLRQIGLEVSLVENLILIVVASLSIGLALALGIGLGLGLKNDAARWIIDFKRKNF